LQVENLVFSLARGRQILQSPRMRIPLWGPSRWLFLGLVVLLAGTVSLAVGRIWLAETWFRSPDPENWKRAAFLAPCVFAPQMARLRGVK